MKRGFAILSFLLGMICMAQQIQLINSEKSGVSFRGLSVVSDSVLWVGGNKGTIGKSTDGGNSFQWFSPAGFEDRDFRAIAGFDKQTAVVIAVASPAVILKTKDGGKNWMEVYRDEHPDVFLDDMSFYSEDLKNGIVVGDPIDGAAYFLQTHDGGESWTRIEELNSVPLAEDEAFFAASNSNIKMTDENTFMIVSGGGASHLIVTGMYIQNVALPKSDSNTSGANGMDYSKDQKYGLIVGGDFMNPKSSANNLLVFEFSKDGLPQISKPQNPPSAYKSGVAILDDGKAISCGMTNVAFSKDKAQNWETISTIGFHSCKKARFGNKVFLAGSDGKIGMLIE